MLTRSASKQWQEDPKIEIFLERDGERFKYCLDYLRDGQVMLPFMVSRNAVLEDLKYYGVENVDKSAIRYNPRKGSQYLYALSGLDDEIEKMEKETLALENESSCRKAAVFCIKKYIANRGLKVRYCTDNRYSSFTPVGVDIDKACADKEQFNEFLARFGLKFESKEYVLSDNSYDVVLSKLED